MWIDYEIRLLGRIRDDELAKLIRRYVGAVAAKRESLGIPIFQARRVGWSKREIELLGKRPDPIVARMLGRSRYAVQLKRYALRIPQCWERRRPGPGMKRLCSVQCVMAKLQKSLDGLLECALAEVREDESSLYSEALNVGLPPNCGCSGNFLMPSSLIRRNVS